MTKAPERGANGTTFGRGYVRVGFSNANTNQFTATPTDSARSQSERDLDLPEAAGRRAEGRVRGMRRRRSLNDWRGGGGGCDHVGQEAAK